MYALPGRPFLYDRYGRQRMWGALGYGLASLISGAVYDAGSGGYRNVMAVFVVVTLISLGASTRVPIGKRAETVAPQECDGPRCAAFWYRRIKYGRVLPSG